MAFLWQQLLVIEQMGNEENRNDTRRIRRGLRDAYNPFEMLPSQFIANFRLNKHAAIDLVESLDRHMPQGHGYITKIPNHLKAKSAITSANMSQSMVSKSIREVANVLIRRFMKLWIKFPRNDEQRLENKTNFIQIHRMNEIIGIVDGTHIAIVKPIENEHVYVNRKGYHSLNMQIICAAQLKIISCNARFPGSTHDSFVGRSTQANYEHGDDNTRIMGDSGYPCLPWLLVPVTNPTTIMEINFNNRFKRARSAIERCIGVLKARFRCLLKERTLHYQPSNAARIVICCAILHNICLHYKVDNPPPIWDDIDLDVANVIDNPQQDVLWRQRGQQSRHQYITTYF